MTRDGTIRKNTASLHQPRGKKEKNGDATYNTRICESQRETKAEAFTTSLRHAKTKRCTGRQHSGSSRSGKSENGQGQEGTGIVGKEEPEFPKC